MKNNHPILLRIQVLWILLLCVAVVAVFLALRNPTPVKLVHKDKRRLESVQQIVRFITDDATELHETEGFRKNLELCGLGSDFDKTAPVMPWQGLNHSLEKIRDSGYLSRDYRFDHVDWLTSIESPQKECAYHVKQLKWLGRPNRLQKLRWLERSYSAGSRSRFTEKNQVVLTPDTFFNNANPWRVQPGCVFFKKRDPENLEISYALGGGLGLSTTCEKEAKLMLPDTEVAKVTAIKPGNAALPDSIKVLLSGLARYRNPVSGGDHKIFDLMVDQQESSPSPRKGSRIGVHVTLTVDPTMQEIATHTARCYSGKEASCRELGIKNPGVGLYENARVRMSGIAVIDIASGEIEAVAGAHTKCFAAINSGSGLPPECSDLAFKSRVRSDYPLNHAIYTESMPGSVVKPIMALGFLRTSSPPSDIWLNKNIKESNSKKFLDHLLCLDKKDFYSSGSKRCRQVHSVIDATHLLGWNSGCDQDNKWCGYHDVLFGRIPGDMPAGYSEIIGESDDLPGEIALYGRFMTTSDNDSPVFRDLRGKELLVSGKNKLFKKCSEKNYKQCENMPSPLVNEGWGQKNARTTPLGVAGMMAQLGAAAQNLKETRLPHLVRELHYPGGEVFKSSIEEQGLTATRQVEISQENAGKIITAMTGTLKKGGTAHAPHTSVFGNDDTSGKIAAKTGTVTVPFGNLRNRKRTCSGDKPPDKCYLKPWKWYAGLFKSKEGLENYDKAFAVLVERNWHKNKNGTLEDVRDRHNIAAEMSFRMIKQVWQRSGANL